MDMHEKIIKDHSRLARRVEELKGQGRRIVFTNGGFNLLHVGHIRSLCDAKSRGDVLVVAVNSDSSVKKNKGGDSEITAQITCSLAHRSGRGLG